MRGQQHLPKQPFQHWRDPPSKTSEERCYAKCKQYSRRNSQGKSQTYQSRNAKSHQKSVDIRDNLSWSHPLWHPITNNLQDHNSHWQKVPGRRRRPKPREQGSTQRQTSLFSSSAKLWYVRLTVKQSIHSLPFDMISSTFPIHTDLPRTSKLLL